MEVTLELSNHYDHWCTRVTLNDEQLKMIVPDSIAVYIKEN